MRLGGAAVFFAGIAAAHAQSNGGDLDAAWEAWARGDRARAASLVRDLVEEDGELTRSVRAAVLLARSSADAAQALERWEHVLSLEPEPRLAAEAHWSRAVAAAASGEHALAIEEFDVVAREYRREIDRGRALLGRGLAELDAGEPGDALESLGDAARIARTVEDRVSADLALASASFRLGNLHEALRRYDKFEREHSKDERARWAAWRAVLCARILGRETDAAERTARLEEKWPGTLEAALAREEVLMGQKSPSPESRSDAEAGDAPPAGEDAPAPEARGK